MKGPTNANGTVTKIGTSSVGTDLKPIKLVNGIPTAVTNDLVDTSSAQTISGLKTINTGDTTGLFILNDRIVFKNKNIINTTSPVSADTQQEIVFSSNENTIKELGKVGFAENTAGDGWLYLRARRYTNTNVQYLRLYASNDGSTGYVTAPSRTYNSANTSDVVTIGSLQSSTDVVHSTGNEVISGTKTYSNMPIIQLASYPIFSYSNTTAVIQCTSAGGSAKRIMFDVIESSGDGKASVLFTISSGNVVTSASKTIIGTMASTVGIVIISNLIYLTVKGACTIKDLYMRYGNSRKVTANMLATPIDVSNTTTYPNQYTVEW